MNTSDIRFFSPEENTNEQQQAQPKTKAPVLTGYISTSGKLVFPAKTAEQLGIARTGTLRVGAEAGKRTVKTLYVIPAEESAPDGFALQKGAKSHFIELGALLKRNGVDFASARYGFTITPFDYQDGVTGYALKLKAETDGAPKQLKAPYMGKPRGRKKKAEAVL